jgi:hypothetical protein
MNSSGKAGMPDEKVLGDTLKYWPTRLQILCNRWRSHLFDYMRIFLMMISNLSIKAFVAFKTFERRHACLDGGPGRIVTNSCPEI